VGLIALLLDALECVVMREVQVPACSRQRVGACETHKQSTNGRAPSRELQTQPANVPKRALPVTSSTIATPFRSEHARAVLAREFGRTHGYRPVDAGAERAGVPSHPQPCALFAAMHNDERLLTCSEALCVANGRLHASLLVAARDSRLGTVSTDRSTLASNHVMQKTTISLLREAAA
jgi:hypothetical protein